MILGPSDRDATMGGKLVFLAGLLSLTALRTARGTYTDYLLLLPVEHGRRISRWDGTGAGEGLEAIWQQRARTTSTGALSGPMA